MSKTTVAIEAAVQAVLAQVPAGGAAQSARQRREVDKAFSQIMTLIAPRVRHFIRQYGLAGHWDDAEQVCAIAVHRAIQTYDQEKAQFTTFVNWLIRGELQSLRFRLMTDQRPSARKVNATTVSISALTQGDDGEDGGFELNIEDESALGLTESGASEYLAGSAMRAMMDSYVDHLRKVAVSQLSRRTRPRRNGDAPRDGDNRPRLKVHAIDAEELQRLEQRLVRNRSLVEQRLFEMSGVVIDEEDQGITKERMRQITKRAAKTIAEIAGNEPKFMIMAETRQAVPQGTRSRAIRLDAGAPASPVGGRLPRRRPPEPLPAEPLDLPMRDPMIVVERPVGAPMSSHSIH